MKPAKILRSHFCTLKGFFLGFFRRTTFQTAFIGTT
jgi:hypothetical protein